MLLGLVREGEGVAAKVLVGLGAEIPRVRQAVIAKLAGYQKPPFPSPEGIQVPASKVDPTSGATGPIWFKGTADLVERIDKAAEDCMMNSSAWLREVVTSAVGLHEKREVEVEEATDEELLLLSRDVHFTARSRLADKGEIRFAISNKVLREAGGFGGDDEESLILPPPIWDLLSKQDERIRDLESRLNFFENSVIRQMFTKGDESETPADDGHTEDEE
jgi:hypothetical protein